MAPMALAGAAGRAGDQVDGAHRDGYGAPGQGLVAPIGGSEVLHVLAFLSIFRASPVIVHPLRPFGEFRSEQEKGEAPARSLREVLLQTRAS
jgi:hypothetical protein